MRKYDVSVIRYAVYEGDNELLGVAEVNLPSLEFLTQTVNGSGIAGEIESILIGQMKAMEITFKWLVLTERGIALSSPEVHTVEIRECQQTVEDNGTLEPTGVKHIIKMLPKKMDGGNLKPHSTSDPSTSASVLYWARHRDGEKLLELDPLNDKCFINGTDYLEPVRKALGK